MSVEAVKTMIDRRDLSQFLIHLTKDGNYEHFAAKAGNPPGFEKTFRTVSAKASLVEIFRNKRIEARSPFGYFKLKIDMYRPYFGRSYFNGGVNPADLFSVCFSETPLRELSDFYRTTTSKRNQYQKYGVAFLQDRLREMGGNPIFYVDSRKKDLLAALDSSLANNPTGFNRMMHLIETFGPLVTPGVEGYSDFRWEREWRKKDSLNFEFEDLAFGICPADEIPAFTQLTQGQVTFIDPDWGEDDLRAYLEKHNPDLIAYL